MISMTCNHCGATITGNTKEVLKWDTNHTKECEKTDDQH